LRAAREAKGITQGDFAKLVGVSEPTVGRWEKGTSAPDATQLPAIAEALGTTVYELMGETVSSKEDSPVDVMKVTLALRTIRNKPEDVGNDDAEILGMLMTQGLNALVKAGKLKPIKGDCEH